MLLLLLIYPHSDDLVIQDPQFFGKFAWFHQLTDHQYILMLHRREPQLLVPQIYMLMGRLICEVTAIRSNNELIVFHEKYLGDSEIQFVEASNPHSGMFCITNQQLVRVRDAQWPPALFVSPLETAATGILLPHFPILKTSWACRNFFEIEHANPSFLSYLGTLPERQCE